MLVFIVCECKQFTMTDTLFIIHQSLATNEYTGNRNEE